MDPSPVPGPWFRQPVKLQQALWLIACFLALLATYGALAYPSWKHDRSLGERVAQRVSPLGLPVAPCPAASDRRRMVILALGQSNAGNHGAVGQFDNSVVTIAIDGKCIFARDPLPGATGQGGSIWQRLAVLLRQQDNQREVVLAVFAVDASSIDDWVRSGSPLRSSLEQQLAYLRRLGLRPDAILWQQGEADARAGVTVASYAEKLDALSNVLDELGMQGPVYLARSTVCRSPANEAIRAAISRKIGLGGRWKSGPDTDQLTGPELRFDDCHFSAKGLDAAARMWLTALAPGNG